MLCIFLLSGGGWEGSLPRSDRSSVGRELGWSRAVSIHPSLGVFGDLSALCSLGPAGLDRSLGQAGLPDCAERPSPA